MDKLPIEVLTTIFQLLPQKYITILSTICKRWQSILCQPMFFNTLNIYSLKQLERCIDMAKKKTIKGTPIGYYVGHLYFYNERTISEENFVDLIDAFPNLHSIHGLKYPTRSGYHVPSLNRLEYISYEYINYDKYWQNIVSNNQHQIKTLEICLDYTFLASTTQHPSSSSSSTSSPLRQSAIYVTQTGLIRCQLPYHRNATDIDYIIYTLELPILSSLTHLFIHCCFEHANENIIESIHHSCPQLYSLTLEYLDMHISNDYDILINNGQIQPNFVLKEFNIRGDSYNSKFCHYLSFKYPRLESLSLEAGSQHLAEHDGISFKLAIYNMITSYQFLKKLSVGTTSDQSPIYWPQIELLTWLQQNPTQLTHLDFPFDFIIIKDIDNLGTNTIDHHNQQQQLEQTYTSIIPSSSSISKHHIDNTNIQQYSYLNNLTRLSLTGSSTTSMDVLYHFLQNQNNSTNIPNLIEELKLSFRSIGNIYDWLDAFPNLKAFSLFGINYIADDYDKDNTNLNHVPSKATYQIFNSNKRKRKQQRNLIDLATTATQFYKLKKFNVEYSKVYFKKKDGWNEFFGRCPELKTIILSHVNDPYEGVNDNEPIYHQPNFFNLSHLSLDYLQLSYFHDSPYKSDISDPLYIDKLMIHETSINKKYYVESDNICKPTQYELSEHSDSTLCITCQYIDHLVFYCREYKYISESWI
ncbi:hypothetical protein BJ944DRAFT_271961 [Cunninghamella echinulata]|nr:hypothetical protein BJ944DRAFT_271961 [Cunninghamella echinulata]